MVKKMKKNEKDSNITLHGEEEKRGACIIAMHPVEFTVPKIIKYLCSLDNDQFGDYKLVNNKLFFGEDVIMEWRE